MVKKSGKKKGPAIYTQAEHLQPFSLGMRELVRTPLGVVGEVIGVKYASADSAANRTGAALKRWAYAHFGLHIAFHQVARSIRGPRHASQEFILQHEPRHHNLTCNHTQGHRASNRSTTIVTLKAGAGGKVWIRYASGLECSIDWDPAHGYTKCSAAEHIDRDIIDHNNAIAAMEEERRRIEEENRMRALGIEPEPKGGGKKSGKGKGKGKKK